jgi:hypothetical protein
MNVSHNSGHGDLLQPCYSQADLPLDVVTAWSCYKHVRSTIGTVHTRCSIFSLYTKPSVMTARPPVLLVPALIASSLLAITLLWNSSIPPKLVMLPPVALAPVGTIAFDVYYIYRIYSRCYNLHASTTKTLTKPWPHTPWMEGKVERARFAPLGWFFMWLNMIFGRSLINDDLDENKSNVNGQHPATTQAPLVTKEMIRLFCAFFQIIACIVIIHQASRLQNEEDKVACQVSHEWRCGRCRQPQHAELKSVQRKAGTHPCSPHLLIAALLSTSTILSVLFGTHFWPNWWTILPALTTIHHGYFLHRLVQAVRQPAAREAWPTVPFFPGVIETLVLYLPLSTLCSMYASGPIILTMSHELWPQVWADPHWTVAYALEILLLGATAFVLWCSLNTEWANKCAREGHDWRCGRDCGTTAPDSSAPRMSAAA